MKSLPPLHAVQSEFQVVAEKENASFVLEIVTEPDGFPKVTKEQKKQTPKPWVNAVLDERGNCWVQKQRWLWNVLLKIPTHKHCFYSGHG